MTRGGRRRSQVEIHDPRLFALVAGVLLGCGVLAAAIPARRAVRIDPAVALRAE